VLSYFSEQLAANASRGLINRVTDVKLLRGDLAEAWREGNTDYATVAMNFALKDSMVERASGQTVEGGEPSEVTELWTSCVRVGAIGCSRPFSRVDVPPECACSCRFVGSAIASRPYYYSYGYYGYGPNPYYGPPCRRVWNGYAWVPAC
jgi:hypothetical protein